MSQLGRKAGPVGPGPARGRPGPGTFDDVAGFRIGRGRDNGAPQARPQNPPYGQQAPQAGGPLGWITVLGKQTELPTYLEGDPGRDWGKVQAIQPYRPNAVGPTLQETDVLRSGLYTPGPLPAPPPGIPSPSR